MIAMLHHAASQVSLSGSVSCIATTQTFSRPPIVPASVHFACSHSVHIVFTSCHSGIGTSVGLYLGLGHSWAFNEQILSPHLLCEILCSQVISDVQLCVRLLAKAEEIAGDYATTMPQDL